MVEFKLQKREGPLAKIEPALAEHLKKLRAAAPESADFLARRMFGDTMVQGVGNKLAWEDFRQRQRKGGAHVLIDGNDFGAINKQWGQTAGDDAIKAMGGALMRASRANRGKLFRVGGDEFRAWFEQPEQAHRFVRHARRELEALPPIQGQHRHSVSVGIAGGPDEAEHALIQAKAAKQAACYAPGHAQTHAHSLLPGAAGPVAVAPQPEIPVSPRPQMPSPVQGPAFQQPLQRSEQDEVEELRLRKFEVDLQKMAVLHDGPQPIPVYRVQNDKGQGPYHGGHDFPDELATSIRANRRRAPGPDKDFTVRDQKDSGLVHNPKVPGDWARAGPRFGFLSSGDAERWFGRDALGEMRDYGFTLRQVLARKVWQSKSGRQILFEPHDAPAAPAPKSE